MRFLLLISCLLLSACAAQKPTPTYVNPNQYTGMDCAALQNETARLDDLIAQKHNEQTPLSATGVGVGVIGSKHGVYPSFSLDFGRAKALGEKRQQLAQLYGNRDAVVIAARQKTCAFATNLRTYSERHKSR